LPAAHPRWVGLAAVACWGKLANVACSGSGEEPPGPALRLAGGACDWSTTSGVPLRPASNGPPSHRL
jgi:hypothetical protein